MRKAAFNKLPQSAIRDLNAPCFSCGGSVSPAFENLLRGSGAKCARCGMMLIDLDWGRGVLTVGGQLPVLYDGVVCTRCGKVECTICKKLS